MNGGTGTGLVVQFREALVDCKRLYVEAARTSLEDQPDADETTRQNLIRRMVDLHKGLLIKVYATVACADSRWGPDEQQLAGELVEHLWQQQLEGEELRRVTRRLLADAGRLKWYSLVRPFDQIARIRDRAAGVETVIMRLANLVAKADGTVTAEEATALRAIQQEIEVHIKRLTLDDDPDTGSAHPTADGLTSPIVHMESTLAPAPAEATAKTLEKHSVADSGPIARREPWEVADSLDQAMQDLQQLVGLESIKKEVTTLTNYLRLQQHRLAAGLPSHPLSLHMVFQGNPGTGKTTVARIVGRIFKSLGLLRKGHLVETDRSGLVAEYAGQTAPRTHRKIDEALDGILFIDEAYSLMSTERSDAYGPEAIQTLVKRMEDDRARLVVILAGYPEPMEALLHSNPGLSSRFNTQMHFEDYSPVELGRIFQRLCDVNQYIVPALVRAKLLLAFEWLYRGRDEHFGNGRLVRNTFENAVRRLADRVATIAPLTRQLLTEFTTDDILLENLPPEIWQHLDEIHLLFDVDCPACRQAAQVRTRQLGKRVRCPHCKSPLDAQWGTPHRD